MLTEMLHGDVIGGLSFYDELDRELVDAELSGYRPVRTCGTLDGDFDCAWSADDGDEFAGRNLERLRNVAGRPDSEVRGDVLRALIADSLVPMTVDAQVCAGIVTLNGTVTMEHEREDAKYLAGLVPGVFGVVDELACWPARGAVGEESAAACATWKFVAAALSRTGIADLADLTIDEPRPATLLISGVVRSRSDHDLAIATCWSVADAVDDCIEVES